MSTKKIVAVLVGVFSVAFVTFAINHAVSAVALTADAYSPQKTVLLAEGSWTRSPQVPIQLAEGSWTRSPQVLVVRV
jgi:hypothetical protein